MRTHPSDANALVFGPGGNLRRGVPNKEAKIYDTW